MRFTFDMQRNIEVLYKLISIFWVCAARHAQATQNKTVAYIYNISRNAWGMKLIFCLHINMKVFYKLIGSISVCVVRLAQSTQINKILISMQYLKENGENKVVFFASRWISKTYSNWYYRFQCVCQGMSKFPKKVSLQCFCYILKRKWVMRLIFCMQISMKVSYKLILWFLMGTVKHSQSSQNSKLSMSLQ